METNKKLLDSNALFLKAFIEYEEKMNEHVKSLEDKISSLERKSQDELAIYSRYYTDNKFSVVFVEARCIMNKCYGFTKIVQDFYKGCSRETLDRFGYHTAKSQQNRYLHGPPEVSEENLKGQLVDLLSELNKFNGLNVISSDAKQMVSTLLQAVEATQHQSQINQILD